jgi:hypothetical protein
MRREAMKFHISAIALGCIALLSACGGGGGGGTDGTVEQTMSFQLPFSGQALIGVPPNSATSTLKATASSGGAVTFTSNTPDICSVSGDQLTLLKLGECSVTATQAGSNGYAPVSQRQVFVVPKNPQMIAKFPNPGWQALDTKPVQLSATFTSGLPAKFTSKTPDVCSVSGTAMTKLANGMCTIIAEQEGNDFYLPALVTGKDTMSVTMAKFMQKDIPIGTEKPAKMNFVTGYKDGDNTNEGLIGHYGNQWWCDSCDRAASGDSFTFTASSDSAPDAWWYSRASFQFFAPGLVDADLLSPDGTYRAAVKETALTTPGAAPKGLQLEIQSALHFNLAQNPEWFGAANNKFGVELFLGHFHQKDGKACNVALKATVQPTAAAATDYSVGLKDQFAFSETCGLSGLDVMDEVQSYPVLEMRFSAVQPNGQVKNAASKYQTQFKLTGPIYFQ